MSIRLFADDAPLFGEGAGLQHAAAEGLPERCDAVGDALSGHLCLSVAGQGPQGQDGERVQVRVASKPSRKPHFLLLLILFFPPPEPEPMCLCSCGTCASRWPTGPRPLQTACRERACVGSPSSPGSGSCLSSKRRSESRSVVLMQHLRGIPRNAI